LIFLSSSLEGVEILVIFRAIRKEKKMVRTKGIGKMLTLISLALFAASLPAFCPSAEGAATFPKKPVTLILYLRRREHQRHHHPLFRRPPVQRAGAESARGQ
jgi:hypothetical protein